MFNWNGLRLRKKPKETAQSPEKEMKNKPAEEKKTVQKTGTGSLKSLLKTAVKDAEQIAKSVRAKAQEEASSEANEIRNKAKTEAEEIISAARKQAESIESEAIARISQLPVTAQENVGKEDVGTKLEENETTVAEEPGGVEEVVELEKPAEASGDSQEKEEEAGTETVSVTEEPDVEETEEKKVEEAGEERETTEPQDEEEAVLVNVQTPVDYDKNTVYGEVELTIAPPTDLKLVAKLYNHLQTVPDLRILYTKGSFDQSTTITIVLEKLLPLVGIISEIPGMEVIPEFIEEERDAKSKPAALFGGEGIVKKIKLTLKGK